MKSHARISKDSFLCRVANLKLLWNHLNIFHSFPICWKPPVNIFSLWVSLPSGSLPRLHYFPFPSHLEMCGLCLVQGRGACCWCSVVWVVDGKGLIVHETTLHTQLSTHGPVGLPLKTVQFFPKHFYLFVLLFPQVWWPAFHSLY